MNNTCNRIQFINIDTISDVWFNLSQILRLPINLILKLIDESPKLQHFFEVNCNSGTDTIWIFVSIFIYFLFFIFIVIIFEL